MRLAKRAEKLKLDHLVKSFVDVGPTYTLLSSTDNQILFGRRGTGKTHFLAVLNNEILNNGTISVSIDMRLIGSTGGIFADRDIALSERATRLLSDTLCTVHEAILDYIWDNNVDNITELTPLLDDFLEQATTISIEGVTEEKKSSSNKLAKNNKANVSLSNKSALINFAAQSTRTDSETEDNKVTGIKSHRIHFGSITKLLNKIVSKLPNNELWILIDEWSETPLDLQPYLAELLRRILFPIPGITVKIAAIAHRCNFREFNPENNTTIGIELGADASSVINLDEYMVFDNDSDAAKEFFKSLLQKHTQALDKQSICESESQLFINDVFSQQSAFDEFVRAAEGVPRDAINIISIAAQTASANRISISCIRKSAQKWFHVTKHNALNSRPAAVILLDRIIHEVIGLRKSRGFLLSNDKSDELIDYLYDMRVIHVLKQGVSAQNTVGKKYTLYALDYGCYVDLMSSRSEPRGLIIEEDDNHELNYVEIPKADYRSIQNSILDLDKFEGQGRLDLITSIDDLQLPHKQKKNTISIKKPLDRKVLNSIPKNVGGFKVNGTVYIPIIFIALVLRKAQGCENCSASDLTNVINEHIITSINRPKVASNNMSRELRKDLFINMEWLARTTSGRSTLFSLNECWPKYWKEYFKKSAPKI